jgi:hypothetical protein
MKTLLIILFSALLSMPNAYGEIAGVVLLAKGNAFATNEQGVKRALKRRSKILEGDILTTTQNSKLQIRFIDKALMTLKAGSRLNVSAYQIAKTEDDTEKVVMDLITGGFRTITGSIGKGEKSAYTVNTPAASIGIRGTNYEIAQEKNGEFVIAVWDGGITVTNDQGSIKVGSDSEFNFVRVKPDEEPEGLDEQPKALTDTSSTSTDTQQDTDEQAEENSSNETTDENSESEDEETASVSEEAVETMDAGTASEGSAQESQLEKEMEKAEETAVSLSEESFPALTEVISPDDRFENIEYTYLLKRPRAGLLVNTGISPATAIENALIIQDSTDINTLKVNLPGSGTGSYNLDSFPLNKNHSDNSQLTNEVQNSQNVSWGKWDGIVALTDNTATTTNPTKSFYWLSAEAANLSSLRGSVSFSGSEGIGDINDSNINDISGKFDVNFANGAIENGSLNVSNTEQSWNVNFNGSVTGVNAIMDTISGDVSGINACSACVSGDIQGVFARPGNHFVGGFALESSNSDTTNGLFSLKQDP